LLSFSVCVAQDNIVCTLKWPSLIAKKTEKISSFYEEISLVGLTPEHDYCFFSQPHRNAFAGLEENLRALVPTHETSKVVFGSQGAVKKFGRTTSLIEQVTDVEIFLFCSQIMKSDA
jgi:hypothetical protein